MLNVLLWYVLVNRLSQVNISMQSYLGKYLVYAGLCTEMNYKIKFPFMWSMGFLLVKYSQEDFKCVSFFFFSDVFVNLKKWLEDVKIQAPGNIHPRPPSTQTNSQTYTEKNEPPLLCINSSVESFKEEFFTKSKLHDHFVDFNFFQKEVLKLQNQILKKKGILM